MKYWPRIVPAAVICVAIWLILDTSASAGKAHGDKTSQNSRPVFTIRKDTTYLTEAIDKDGYPDYVAALNKHYAQGVTAANNTAVLLWQSSGPDHDATKRSPEFFRLLGMEPPADRGEFFVEFHAYANKQLGIDLADADRAKELDDHLDQATERPWRANDYPAIASWLKGNEKPLAVLVEASKRPRYFSPLVRVNTKDGPSGLYEPYVLVPGKSAARSLGQALMARAMLRIGEAKHRSAWEDLLACHKLGRLFSQNRSLMTDLLGMALESMACAGELVYLDSVRPDGRALERCLCDLQKLPARSQVAETFDLGERCMVLDTILTAARHGVEHFEDSFRLWLAFRAIREPEPVDNKPGFKAFPKPIPRNANWDIALRNANRWHDRCVAALRQKDHRLRKEQCDQITADVKALQDRIFKNWNQTLELLGDKKQSPNVRGEAIGNMLICTSSAPIGKIQQASDRCQQTNENLLLAFALARYQRDHGRYPKTLGQLAPKYLTEIPLDRFSGRVLIYRPSKSGYLLYSVGANGKDDGGKTYHDDPPADDIAVRMPLSRSEKR
jgi:hypothetical protein